jgi:hypothetical protein
MIPSMSEHFDDTHFTHLHSHSYLHETEVEFNSSYDIDNFDSKMLQAFNEISNERCQKKNLAKKTYL